MRHTSVTMATEWGASLRRCGTSACFVKRAKQLVTRHPVGGVLFGANAQESEQETRTIRAAGFLCVCLHLSCGLSFLEYFEDKRGNLMRRPRAASVVLASCAPV